MSPMLRDPSRLMISRILLSSILRIAFVTLLLAAAHLPATATAEEPKSGSTAFSLSDFEDRYDRDSKDFKTIPGKTPFAQWEALLGKMVRAEVFEHGRRRILDALVRQKSQPTTTEDFQRLVSCDLISHFIYHGDEVGLVEILSFRCPPHWRVQMPLEFELALSTDTIERGLLVLCDAYDKSTEQSNRDIIVKLLRRANLVVETQNTTDKQFVNNCREWLKLNSHAMEVNPDYGIPDHPNAPLFIPKP